MLFPHVTPEQDFVERHLKKDKILMLVKIKKSIDEYYDKYVGHKRKRFWWTDNQDIEINEKTDTLCNNLSNSGLATRVEQLVK